MLHQTANCTDRSRSPVARVTKARLLAASAAVFALLPVASATAGDSLNPVLDDRIVFSVGAMFPTVDVKVAKWASGETRDVVDLDRLGVPNDDTDLWASVKWRVTDRWRLGMDYFRLGVAGSKTVNFEYEFGDLVVPIGAFVASSLKMDFYVFSVGYDLYRSDRAEMGLGVGVHAVDMSYDMYAEATAGSASTVIGEEKEDFVAPLPNLVVYGVYAFSKRFSGRTELSWLSLTVGDYDGDLLGANAHVAYRMSKHTSVGVGYNYLHLKVTRDNSTNHEYYNMDTRGPRVFLRVSF